MQRASLFFFSIITFTLTSFAEERVFDITTFGATANDDSDDTLAILKALDAAKEASGGVVFVPSGSLIMGLVIRFSLFLAALQHFAKALEDQKK